MRHLRACLMTLISFSTLALAAAGAAPAAQRPLPFDAIAVRGNTEHPRVNLTPADVAAARERVANFAWARQERDEILAAAEPWLRQSGEYWLGFLPGPDACYAYGFTGCPICGGRTNTTPGVNSNPIASWDDPGHIRCENGHRLPDDDHPDTGTGYVDDNGRIFYLVGQFNAFVVEQWSVRALPALSQAYLLTGDEKYAERGLLFLDALASIYKESTKGGWDYPNDPVSGRLIRPWYQVARVLVQYVDHYDAMYNSPAADKPSLRPGMTRHENIERNMMLDGAYYCYEHSWAGALTNGHADYLRGALAVGCLLDIPEYIDAAVNGPFSINVMLSNNLDRDGRYYETAPLYAAHSRQLYLTFADPLFNLRSAEYPEGINLYDDPRLQTTMTLPELQFELAGRRPNFGDSAPQISYAEPPKRLFNETDYLFMERLHARASDPAARARFGAMLHFLADGKLESLRAQHGRNWLLWHAAEPPAAGDGLTPALQSRLTGAWFAGMKGVAIMRAGGQQLLMRFGPSLNHGDPDDLSLLYCAAGFPLAYDIGYGLASTHVQVGWGSSTVSHPLVTVNEKNQLEGEGGGGSLLGFAALPSVQFADADSPLSYTSEGVKVYRRALALTEAGYLVDCFRVEGGEQHDYAFGSLGTALEPFGAGELTLTSGSLAAGIAWGEQIGSDGDVLGHPNKPYWNPPPGTGYGFFHNVRRGRPTGGTWGGTWSITNVHPKDPKAGLDGQLVASTDHTARLRVHMAGDEAEPVFADGPGLYPHLPRASYVMARRGGVNLRSTFLAVYEPYANRTGAPVPILDRVERIGERALSVRRTDGAVDILIFGSHDFDSVYGPVRFKGDFAFITGDGKSPTLAETTGCESLRVGGATLIEGPGAIAATITAVDPAARSVELDAALPADLAGLTALFSSPAWSRTSAYRIAGSAGRRLLLETASLSLGQGRMQKIESPAEFISDIPHEYARTHRRKPSRFFDGKQIAGRDGASARITAVSADSPMKVSVTDATNLREGELYEIIDLAAGAKVRIPLQATWNSPKP